MTTTQTDRKTAMPIMTRYLATLGIFIALIGGLTACGKKDLTDKSSCKDFLAASQDDQNSAINRIAGQLHAPESVTPLGRPNIYSICAADPSRTLGFAIQRTG